MRKSLEQPTHIGNPTQTEGHAKHSLFNLLELLTNDISIGAGLQMQREFAPHIGGGTFRKGGTHTIKFENC